MDYKNCKLCPRLCGIDRTAGEVGYCGMGDELRVSHGGLHHWEEPIISGIRGSGTVFFAGCSLGCKFCQNSEISLEKKGRVMSSQGLRSLFLDLIDQGAENINLVTATHFLPHIQEALLPKLPVPVVYNCGGFEQVETLKSLEGLVDIYLPDFKFWGKSLGAELANAEDYRDVAKSAIREMVRQTGKPILENNLLKRGTVIRHLILPGQVENSLDILDWIKENFGKDEVILSLMAQYVPHGVVANTPPYDRGITEEEYASVVSWAKLLGFENGYIQERESASDLYLPHFNLI